MNGVEVPRVGSVRRTGDVAPPIVPHGLAVLCVSVCCLVPFAGENMALGVIGLVLLALVAGTTGVRHQPVPALLVVLLLYVAASIAWSISPLGTALVTFQTVITTSTLLVIMTGRDGTGMVRVVSDALALLLVAGWIVALSVPGVGFDQSAYETGSFEGLFVHRNITAFAALVAFVSFLLRLGPADRHRRAYPAAMAALALVSVVAAQSRTAWVVGVTTIVVMLGIHLVTRSLAPVLLPAALCVVVALGMAAAVFSTFTAILVSVGRDPTLTGRTEIWAAVWSAILRKPAQGYGWGGVWQDSWLSADFADEVGFRFFHAHDGYLDVWLQVGAVGLVLLVLVVIDVLSKTLRQHLGVRTLASTWSLAVLTVLLLSNSTETFFVNGPGWVVLVSVTLIAADTVPVASSAGSGPYLTERSVS